MNEQNISQSAKAESSQTLSVGAQFRQAREKLGLSLDEAAAKIGLRASILQCIENDEFSHKKIPVTFMKGYMRNYAKLLKLPEEVWISAVDNFGEKPKNDFNKVARVERVTNPHSHNRWVGYLTAIVILFVVAMTALWWWENYQQSNNERDNLVQSYTPASEEISAVLPKAEQAQTESVSVNSEEPKVESNTTSNEQSLLPASQVNSAPEAANSQQNVVPAEAVSQTQSTETATTATQDNNVQDSQQTAASDEASAPTPAVTGDLQIEVTSATSWISVRNSARKVLAQKEYKQGEVLTFDKGAPYAVIIGAPGNVKVTYKGENYPLKVDGRVAKFKLQ